MAGFSAEPRQATTHQALTLPQVQAKIGAGKTFIYRSMKDGTFPRPLRISRFTRWLESEIDQWLSERIAERDNGASDAIAQRASLKGSKAVAARQAKGAA